MRKIVLGVAVSLDAFIEGPHGEYDWCFTDQDYGLNEFFKRIDTVFVGRKSFEVVGQEGTPAFNGMRTYIFSNTLNSAPKGTELVSGDIVTKIKHIKDSPGKDIWLFGGAQLTEIFIRNNLIDEYWLSIHPVILGSGKPLFQGLANRNWLRLVEHKVYDTGLVSLKYEPTKK